MESKSDLLNRCAKCSATGVLASLLGMVVMLLVGVISWEMARGINGLLLAALSGAGAALLMRWRLGWPVSVIAGFVGAALAAFAAISTGEVWEPGSLEWAVKGGLYGGILAVVMGSLLGLLALGRTRKS